MEEARARGVDVTIDQYPYTASSTGIAALVPQWALEGGQKSTVERLAAPDQRAQIKAAIVQNLKVDRGAGDPKNVAIVNCSFDRSLAGKNLAQLTQARGAEPTMENAAETAMELVNEGRLLGGLPRHRRGGRGAHHAVPVHDDRVAMAISRCSARRRRIRAATARSRACWAFMCGRRMC